MTGIVYAVKNVDGKTVKIGSTAGQLKVRTRAYRKEHWFQGHSLVPIRMVEHDDANFFIWYLRAVETIEIARNRTWIEQGGRNLVCPLRQQCANLERFKEICRAGGLASGLKAKKSGQISALGKRHGPILGRQNIESGHIQQLGRRNAGRPNYAAGRIAKESGQASQLGKTYGKIYAPLNGRKTRFKKHQRPWNWLPLGTVRVDSNGYLRRKIADGPGGYSNVLVWAFGSKAKAPR